MTAGNRDGRSPRGRINARPSPMEEPMYDDDNDEVPGWWFLVAPMVGLVMILLTAWYLWG